MNKDTINYHKVDTTNRFAILTAIAWTIIIIGSGSWSIINDRNHVHDLIENEARVNFNKDHAFRYWATKHGGVYVPVTDETPPNKYLANVLERDIVTRSGKQLTLMNPAYMVRQITKYFEETYGVPARITSLNVLNPINKPDEWEMRVLKSFKSGAEEVMEYALMDGKPYLRLMRPMYTEEGCLKCHGFQGYKVGETRGGVNVSILFAPYEAMMNDKLFTVLVSHLSIWAMGLIGIAIVSISSKKRNIEKWKSEEVKTRFMNILNESHYEIYVFRVDTLRFVDVNKRAIENIGYTLDELKKLTPLDLKPEQTLQSFAKLIEPLKTGIKDKIVFDSVHKRKDGSMYNVEVHLHDTEKESLPVFVAIVLDITERKMMENEVFKAQKLESIGILAGGIAHDFNNILTAISGNVQLAMMLPKVGNKPYEFLQNIEKASTRARDLTLQLLTFAKGGAPIKKIASITGLVKDSTQFSLRGTSVKAVFGIPDDTWHVDIDEGQINQVINNLVINAQQAMPDGGILKVSTGNINEETSKKITLLEHRQYVRISFEDSGIGISQDGLTKIFDPYYTTKQKGSGLGLASSYSIVKKHGGLITVASELNVGTTFNVFIPATSKEIVKVGNKNKPVIGKGKILVMDDDEMIRDMANTMLTSIGYKVECAKDGNEAIETYIKAKEEGNTFDVVLMDLTIPGGMGGKRAIKKLHETEPKAKAVIYSGYSNDPILANCKKYGFKGFVSKPFKIEELNEVLERVING